mgnify:CR=1 FL=1|tara:strand:+ start:10885 stop:11310 length:426 start_codon:yes stop_codon:yes gene_type:complete
MARTHGKNVNYSFDAIAIEDELSSVVQTIDVPEAEITAFTDAYKNFLAGKKNVRTDIEGSYDQLASQGVATIFAAVTGGPVSTVFDPTGSGPGANDPEYQCTASGLSGVLVAGLVMRFPVGDKASYSASLQHSGSTTRATA